VRLRAAIELLNGRASAAAAAFLEAAALVETERPPDAATSLVDACEAFLYHGDLASALDAGRRARALVPTDAGAGDALVEIAFGEALAIAGRTDEGAPRLERALELVAGSEELRRDARCLARAAIALWWLDRPAAGRELALVAIGVARERGAGGALPYALEVAAVHERRLGLWSSGYASALEATALARETAQPSMAAHCLAYMAAIDGARGHEEACRRGAAEASELAERAGLQPLRLRVECMLGRVDLGAGRLDAAIERLEPARAAVLELGHCEPDIAPWPDLVEAYVRTGDLERARQVRAELEATRLGSAPLWPRAAAALCDGLLAPDDAFDQHFETALSLQERIGDRFAAARVRLCHGERQRRAGRRTDAREQLRPALAAFDELGAQPWAERAGLELRASGETLRRRVAFDDEQLTPQELQIAAHVAEGKTNKEVGAALFLSHKTVESHLAHVYRKLGIHSRAELIRLFASGEGPAAASSTAAEPPIVER
jgi:DNA-binding CsgD family transcriptional regulator